MKYGAALIIALSKLLSLKSFRENVFILAGACVVYPACVLTVSAGYPQWFAPFAMPVLIPMLLLYGHLSNSFVVLAFTAPVPLVTLYLGWSFRLGKTNEISRISAWFATLCLILSLAMICLTITQGLDYRSRSHMLLMLGYNLLSLVVLGLIFIINRRRPSKRSTQLFHIALFTWLGWAGFPYLGELP